MQPYRPFTPVLPVLAVILLGSCQLDLRSPLIRNPYTVAPPTITASNWNNFKNGLIRIIPPAMPGVQIFYTTNGDDPSTQGRQYSGPIFLSEPGKKEIRAIARFANLDSPAAIAEYTIGNTGNKFPGKVVIFVPSDGLARNPDPSSGKVIIRLGRSGIPHFRIDAQPSSGIQYFYTTDGSMPRIDWSGNPLTSSTRQLKAKSAPLLTSGTHYLKVIALRPGRTPSNVEEVQYQVYTPVSEKGTGEIVIDLSRLATDGSTYYINKKLAASGAALITITGPGDSHQWCLNSLPDGTCPNPKGWQLVTAKGLNYDELQSGDLKDGQNFISVRALNAAGKIIETKDEAFTVDIKPPSEPTITFNKFTRGTPPSLNAAKWKGSWNITIKTNNREPNIKHSWSLKLKGSETGTNILKSGSNTLSKSTLSHSLPSDGTYTLTAVSEDPAGNQSKKAADFELNTALPHIRITPEGFTPASDGKRYLNDGGIEGESWSIPITAKPGTQTTWVLKGPSPLPPEGTTPAAIPSGGRTALTPGNLKDPSGEDYVSDDGEYTLEITSKDSKGNERKVTFKFTLDTKAPERPTINLTNFVTDTAGKKYAYLDKRPAPAIEIIIPFETGVTHTGRWEKLVSGTADTKLFTKLTPPGEKPKQLDKIPLFPKYGYGEYKVTVISQDLAGNKSTASETFTVNAASPP